MEEVLEISFGHGAVEGLGAGEGLVSGAYKFTLSDCKDPGSIPPTRQ